MHCYSKNGHVDVVDLIMQHSADVNISRPDGKTPKTNHSCQTLAVPSEIKTAVTKPLLKKPSLDPNKLKNYRPISNLPSFFFSLSFFFFFFFFFFCLLFFFFFFFFGQNFCCSSTTCVLSVNTQSAQHPSVCLPAFCSSPHTQRSPRFP